MEVVIGCLVPGEPWCKGTIRASVGYEVVSNYLSGDGCGGFSQPTQAFI